MLGWLAAAWIAGACIGPLRAQNASAQADADAVALQAYRQAEPLVKWPLTTLLHRIPELKHLEPSDDQTALAPILKHVAESVSSFVANSLNTTALETIDQTLTFGIFVARGQTISRSERFHYLMVVGAPNPGGLPKLEEYRTGMHGGSEDYLKGSSGFYATKGFASMPLVFSQPNHTRSAFRYLGTELVGKSPTLVVGFSNYPDLDAGFGTFIDEGVTLSLLIQGVAWIDPVTYQIERMRTDLLAPQPAVGLDGLTTEAQFRPINFRKRAAPLWLPTDVKVTMHLKKATYINRHRYKNYELFQVDTHQDLDTPKTTGNPPPQAGNPAHLR